MELDELGGSYLGCIDRCAVVVPGCCCAGLDELGGSYLGCRGHHNAREFLSRDLSVTRCRLLLCVTMPLPEWESLTHIWGGLSLWPTWLAEPRASANNGPNPPNAPNILAGMSPREPPGSPAEKRVRARVRGRLADGSVVYDGEWIDGEPVNFAP